MMNFHWKQIYTSCIVIVFFFVVMCANSKWENISKKFVYANKLNKDMPYSYSSMLVSNNPVEIVKFVIMDQHSKVLSFEKILGLFTDPASGIHNFFHNLLRTHFKYAETGEGYFFECPAITAITVTRDFEFVLIPSRALSKVKANCRAFSEHLSEAGNQSVVSFPNIGGDTLLIVPCPLLSSNVIPTTDTADNVTDSIHSHTCSIDTKNSYTYAHLADFIKTAPAVQQLQLWKKLAEETIRRLSSLSDGQKLWISTSGLGVSWLHIRLDSVPKYYNYEPYQES